MKVYNTYSKKLEEFKPNKRIVMYVCGLTPYDHMHVGHLRTYVAYDMLKRYLIQKGFRIFHIQNITDVDDKIIRRSKESGIAPERLTERFHDEALEVLDKIGVIRADVYPKVTGHISQIIKLIERLIEKGYAYETDTGVYFSIRRFKRYGRLSGQDLKRIIAGARIEPDETKRAPEDFALWKKTAGEIIEFDSPWGRGRPGWHIECSAMGLHYGDIDVHGGAQDLIFPHHENEIAQSEAATGKTFVKYWVHTGFLTVKGEKMSKSLRNFITAKEVLEKFSPNVIRMFFALTKYSSPLDYDEEKIKAAEKAVERIFTTMRSLEERGTGEERKLEKVVDEEMKKFYKALDEDFDLPKALGIFFTVLHIINKELKGAHPDTLKKIKEYIERVMFIIGLKREEREVNVLGDVVNLLLDVRERLRKKGEYKLADEIRRKLRELGIEVEDNEEGTEWRLK